MVKIVFCCLLGMLPGILLVACGIRSLGFSLIALGSLIGTLLGVPGVSLSRVGGLLVAMLIGYNIPIGDDLNEGGDGEETAATSALDFNDRLISWLRAEDVTHRRTLWVVAGMVTGMLAGVAVALHDIAAVRANQPAWLLPFGAGQEEILFQGFELAGACALWGGALVAILGAPAYGRSIAVATPFGGFCAYAAGMAVGIGQARPTWFLAFAGSTFAIVIALFVGFVITLDINEVNSKAVELSDLPDDNSEISL